MKQTILKSTLVAAALTASFSALAIPPALEAAKRSGTSIVKEFDAGSGMKGYVVEMGNSGDYQVIYGSPDDKLLIAGQLIDGAGKNLTADHMAQYVPQPDYTAVWPKVEAVKHAVKMNSKAKGPVVYIMADANCPFCHYVDEAFRPYVETGKVDVRVLHVAFLRPDSATKAAAIMGAKDPAAALKEHGEKFDKGGITPAGTVKPEFKEAMDKAAALMQELKASGTPTVIFKNKEGKVEVLKGMPTLNDVARIAQMPKIENKNPKLNRFDR